MFLNLICIFDIISVIMSEVSAVTSTIFDIVAARKETGGTPTT
jgi:hypothetical protein